MYGECQRSRARRGGNGCVRVLSASRARTQRGRPRAAFRTKPGASICGGELVLNVHHHAQNTNDEN